MDKLAKLQRIGLRNNPCQGCEAYYAASPPATVCALEIDGACDWIKLHDTALAIPVWIPVTHRLPPAGVLVIALVAPNDYGKIRRIRAQYAPPKTLEQSPECDGGEYDEATDTYYCAQGWYETNEYEDVHWNVGGVVTHWMALPLPPVEGHNATHEGPGAASSRTVPLDAVVGPLIGEKE